MKANKKLGAKPNRVILNCETNKAPNIAKKLADKMGDSYIKLEEELSNQQPVILTERQLFPCEIVDCDDYETYSEANDKLGERMYEIAKDNTGNVLLNSQRLFFQENQIAFGEISPSEMIGIASNNGKYISI